MAYCTKCGTENRDNAVYCSECGQNLQEILYEEGELPETSNGESETLQEMIHVAWNKGTVPPRKILCFTDENVYIVEGSFLVGGLGYGMGGLIGRAIEKKDTSDKEKKARENFQELAARDPEVVVIPYNEIINVTMGKKRMLLNPSIKIETTSDDYKFTVMEGKKYKQYQKTIPALLGDKVNVE
jgi:hypothetical protein